MEYHVWRNNSSYGFSDDVKVQAIEITASDDMVVAAARVSTLGDRSDVVDADEHRGLINFLVKNRHGSPFEHNMFNFRVSAPIFVWREHMRHRIGFCLPGSAEIPVGTQKNGSTKRLDKVYSDWKEGVKDSLGRTRLLPSTRHLTTRTLNLDTGLFEHAKMVDVYRSGIKPILKVELASGHVLRCTTDHRVWTTEGWVRAGDLTTQSLVARMGKVVTGDPLGIPKRLREGIQIWTTEQKRTLVGAQGECYSCGKWFIHRRLELDHVVPVCADLTKALDVNNLKPICETCHRAKTNTEQQISRRRTQQLGARYERVIDVRPDGEEMTYDIEMPAPWHNFVADGVVVHNSYNEESGRYKELEPVFYLPGPSRKLRQVGKAGKYDFEPGTEVHQWILKDEVEAASVASYTAYQSLLKAGIAREVARMVLPVNIFSTAYVTMNARSLMNFLSLRTKHEGSTFPSFPQREIEMVAERYEEAFATAMPITYAAFNDNGRVAP